VAGNASVVDVNDYLPKPLPESPTYESIGGLLIDHLERIPNEQEIVRMAGYEITVLKKQQNHIDQVQLRILPDDQD
jgi:Mg2+/Co2+ transporter CorB